MKLPTHLCLFVSQTGGSSESLGAAIFSRLKLTLQVRRRTLTLLIGCSTRPNFFFDCCHGVSNIDTSLPAAISSSSDGRKNTTHSNNNSSYLRAALQRANNLSAHLTILLDLVPRVSSSPGSILRGGGRNEEKLSDRDVASRRPNLIAVRMRCR